MQSVHSKVSHTVVMLTAQLLTTAQQPYSFMTYSTIQMCFG